MRLYKMELYKICSKRIFYFSALAALAILLLYFWSFVFAAESTVNGVRYTGYQAVKQDREITRAFQGELTDQKVTQIIEKYGFPSGVRDDYNVFLDRNYLNQFIMKGFSDGYFHGADNYHVGTLTYPIAETALGMACAATGKTLILAYSYGWQVFTEVLQVGCVLGMALVLFAVSPVFSEESAVNTRQILFTTKEGLTRDIAAKIAAGLTVAVGVYAVIVLLDFVLVWCVFGLDGLDCFYSQVMDELHFISAWNNYDNAEMDYMRDFIVYYIGACFLGFVETGAIALYFSAHFKSVFQSIVASAMALLVPLLLFMLSSLEGVLFILCQAYLLVLLGIVLMCFIPDTIDRRLSFIARTLCFVLPLAAAYFLRRLFIFYAALPEWLVMRAMYSDWGVFRKGFGWVPLVIFALAVVASIVFIVGSGKKYRRL